MKKAPAGDNRMGAFELAVEGGFLLAGMLPQMNGSVKAFLFPSNPCFAAAPLNHTAPMRADTLTSTLPSAYSGRTTRSSSTGIACSLGSAARVARHPVVVQCDNATIN
jgi:hypothetical protein